MKIRKPGVITQRQQVEIDRLMSQITCDKDFQCVKHKFNVLCKTKKVDGVDYLVCLEGNGPSCRFYNKVYGKGICGCPLRKIAARIVSSQEEDDDR